MEVFNLNIRPGKTCPVIHCSQFDKGRTFRANLYDGSEVFTLTAAETLSVIEKKSDGNMVTIGVTNTSDSYVEFATTEQMTALAGPQICELRIVEGDTLIGSANFILDCEESPDTGIESESEIHNLETQIQDINEQIVPDMVAEEVSNQYDSSNVIFDDHPTEGHGTGYVVKSENVPDELYDLDDVNIDDESLERGQALVYNPGTGKWENDTIPQTGTIENVAIASFPDGADDVPVSELIVDINPVQDLHGYDKPWVGGAGKNLYVGSPSFDGYTDLDRWTKQNETYNGHEVYKNNGDWQGLYKSFPLKAGTYTFSVMMKSDESDTTVRLYNDNGTQLAYFSVGTAWQRYSAQFTISADTDSSSIRIETMDGHSVYISEYQLELGSTATSYEPYSNICPITGFDSGVITRCGVNLWDEKWEVGAYSTTTGEKVFSDSCIRSVNKIPIKPNTTYYGYYGKLTDALFALFYDISGDYININNSPVNITRHTFTTPNNAYYMVFRTFARGVVTDIYENNISINYPSSDTQYHSYIGNNYYTVAFGQTVYGGFFDNRGNLVVTHGIVDLGSLDYSYSSGTQMFVNDSLVYKAPTNKDSMPNAICSQYAAKTWTEGTADLSLDSIFCMLTSPLQFRIRDTRFTDANAFKTAMSGAMLVYELATPTVYQLTPTQINNLLGLNNLYSDTGDLSVKYKSGGVIQTQTGDIVTFTVGVGDMDKGTLLNRLITGNYDKIRLKKGENVISFTGNVKQVSIDKYSRWI